MIRRPAINLFTTVTESQHHVGVSDDDHVHTLHLKTNKTTEGF